MSNMTLAYSLAWMSMTVLFVAVVVVIMVAYLRWVFRINKVVRELEITSAGIKYIGDILEGQNRMIRDIHGLVTQWADESDRLSTYDSSAQADEDERPKE